MDEAHALRQGVLGQDSRFDEKGNETTIDYRKMLEIVCKAQVFGLRGIEYEGSKLPEAEGVKKTKALLETIRKEWEA